MQDHGQPHGYQRPPSVASSTVPPPLPPRNYGVPQGIQSLAPNTPSQWGPGSNQAPTPWAQQQQHVAVRYIQGSVGVPANVTAAAQPPYPPQHSQSHPVQPPPPLELRGFAAAVHRQQQQQYQQQIQYHSQQYQPNEWPQQAQDASDFTSSAPHRIYPAQAIPQPYSHAGPPPPSDIATYSSYPPAQLGRPGSVYSASHISTLATPLSTGIQYASTIENTSSPYVAPPPPPPPPPPSVPSWQQAYQTPPQPCRTHFGYTEPSVNSDYNTPVYQDSNSSNSNYQSQSQRMYAMQVDHTHGQQTQGYTTPQSAHEAQPQQPYIQPLQPENQLQRQPESQPPYGETQSSQLTQQTCNVGNQVNWQTLPNIEQCNPMPQKASPYFSQEFLYPDNQVQALHPTQQNQASRHGGSAPNPSDGINTSSPHHSSHPSPQSQPVSPIGLQQDTNMGSGMQMRHVLSETEYVSTPINCQSQRLDAYATPSDPGPHNATRLLLRDDNSKFSALGAGAPSEWEHLNGNKTAIGDADASGGKTKEKTTAIPALDSVELPAHIPSPLSTHSWPSPAQSVPLDLSGRRSTYATTPPAGIEPFLELTIQKSLLSWDPDSIRTNSECITSQKAPAQAAANWELQAREKYNAERAARDGVLEHLRIDTEKEKASLQNQIEKLKADVAMLQSSAASEISGLRVELEASKATTERVTVELDVVRKEKDGKIESLTKHAEEKEHDVDEKDDTIAGLKHLLEDEKSREVPKATPDDLIPDIDPWYIRSLERYTAMLRSEANEPEIEGKIKIFRAFCKIESDIRGIDYYETPPPTSLAVNPLLQQLGQSTATPTASNISTPKQDLKLHVPQDPMPEVEEHDFSPGGRPIFKRKATLPLPGDISTPPQSNASSQSTMILTPASSIESNDKNNTISIQVPSDEQLQPQYKAYVPAAPALDHILLAHRLIPSLSGPPHTAFPKGKNNSSDEVFFGTTKLSAAEMRRYSSESQNDIVRRSSDVSVAMPAPLNSASSRSASTTVATSQQDQSDSLANIIPAKLMPNDSNQLLRKVQAQLELFDSSVNDIDKLKTSWEKSASQDRRKKDDARRKRQEENEEHNDYLFNSKEISYAEVNQLEETFKQKEGEVKAQEDRTEYSGYVKAVFDIVYENLHTDIKALTVLCVEIESLLAISVSGLQCLSGDDAPSTKDCLESLRNLHEAIEKRHGAIVEAVAERDKRCKKTELQPLYAAGDIARMKELERHFNIAEKQAMLRAKREKAERVAKFVKLAEEAVVQAVGKAQHDVDRMVSAIKKIGDNQGDTELLTRAHGTLRLLKSSSSTLLAFFNGLEQSLNHSVLEAKIAQVKTEGGSAVRVQELEYEKLEGATKMAAEYKRRITVLEQDDDEIEELVQRKSGKAGVVRIDELDRGKEERRKAALEAAKRRNGAA